MTSNVRKILENTTKMYGHKLLLFTYQFKHDILLHKGVIISN